MGISKYLNFEFIGFCIIISICVYFYFNFDKKKISTKSLLDDLNDILKSDLSTFDEGEYKENIKVKPKKKKKFLKSENKCKTIFEKIFNKPFPSVRPDFLKNPVTGLNLELDGYCEELKLAFEYQGEQHAKYIPHFHRSGPKEFMYQVKKDDYKAKICKLKGIELIQIPHYIHFDKLEEYIIRILRKNKKFSNYI